MEFSNSSSFSGNMGCLSRLADEESYPQTLQNGNEKSPKKP